MSGTSERLLSFENDLLNLVKNVLFRYIQNEFQDKLSSGLKAINSSNKMLTPADKTSSMYRFS